jgi:hypothetical protein
MSNVPKAALKAGSDAIRDKYPGLRVHPDDISETVLEAAYESLNPAGQDAPAPAPVKKSAPKPEEPKSVV